MPRRKLTEILQEMDLIDENQIAMALKRQHMISARIGTQLIHLGIIDEDQLAEALSRLYGVPSLKMEKVHQISDDVRSSIPKEIVKKYRILPVKKTDRMTTVAMINPGDLELIQELEFRLGSNIEVFVCPEVTMEYGLHLLYGIEPNKDYLTLVDERGRVQIQQSAKKASRDSQASRAGFKDLDYYVQSNLLAGVAYQMGSAKDHKEAVACAMKKAKAVVQTVELYLVRPSEGNATRWGGASSHSDDWSSGSTIRLSEINGLMEKMHKNRFLFGEKSLLPDEGAVGRFCSPYTKKTLFVPIIVNNKVLAFLYADNGQWDMTLNHLEDLLGLSALIRLALSVKFPSRTSQVPRASVA